MGRIKSGQEKGTAVCLERGKVHQLEKGRNNRLERQRKKRQWKSWYQKSSGDGRGCLERKNQNACPPESHGTM